ncbi:MAG: hypothetical protein EZS28_025949 [Streblomastix strix]|uniref:Uncharacterized protein n=1 Tax=Streblomastix strix TaxID=222440 RepID=A0A5J4V848_9EUKA|nr:MAG: hypothetical protein EZS28_025949 [Streblomastix strix]
MGDQANSAEDLLVWVYQESWIETDQIVTDQVIPASDNTPSVDSGAGVAGIQTDYAGGDHYHHLQVCSVLPSKNNANGEEGVANTYARSDHTHHVNLSSDTLLKDTGTGTAGTSSEYASATHQHPLNIDPRSANVPLVNATAAANGSSDYYCRNDHVRPQQLNYDGSITATKFINTGGTTNGIMLADGSTRQSSLAGGQYQVIESPQYIKFCTFIALNTSTDNSIKFKVNTRTGFGQIQFNQYWTSGVEISRYQYLFIPSLATEYSDIFQLYSYSLSGFVQVDPTGDSYNEGIQLSRSKSTKYCGIYMVCNPQQQVGSLSDQWTIVNTPDGTFRIDVNQQLGSSDQGLMISADGSTIFFNNKVNTNIMNVCQLYIQ